MEEILEYERLVYSVVKKFSGYDVEDLKQVGMIGLAKAYKNYNESFNTKFSTYAYTYILGEVLSYIRESRSFKISREYGTLYKKINEAKDVLRQRLMREVSNFEVACFLEIDEKLVDEVMLANSKVQSLDASLNEFDEDKEINLYDFAKYNEKMYDAENLDLLMELDSLDEVEKELIYDRYFNDLTQNEVSKKLSMSQVQVSRNEAKILKKLRDRLVAWFCSYIFKNSCLKIDLSV